jgi:hypothetical protein
MAIYEIKTFCFDCLPIRQNREGINYFLAILEVAPWSSVVWLLEISKCDGQKCCYYVLGHNDTPCAFWQWQVAFSTGPREIHSSISSNSISPPLYSMIFCRNRYFDIQHLTQNEQCLVQSWMRLVAERPSGLEPLWYSGGLMVRSKMTRFTQTVVATIKVSREWPNQSLKCSF